MNQVHEVSNLREVVHDSGLHDTFAQDVVEGLTSPRGEKAIPSKHLYDATGSNLFEQICQLEVYYPTRTEASIFRDRMPEIARHLGTGVALVEPGAGDGHKAERLLDALDDPRAFAPVEISDQALIDASRRIALRFPDIDVHPVCAEFAPGLEHLDALPDDQRVVFFPGSTIGNLTALQRAQLLSSFRRFVGESGRVLVGFDLAKDRDVLRAAYDDTQGVTAAFNLNLIDRINRDLGANLDRSGFRHEAVWIEDKSRIEMRLLSTKEHRTRVMDQDVVIEKDERIHTENSHKFTEDCIRNEAGAAGLDVVDWWTDARQWFSLVLMAPTDADSL